MSKHLLIALTVGLGLTACTAPPPGQADTWDGMLVQFGTMHEAIGQQQDEGRVLLSELARPGFYGVAALAGLAGEVTILDGKPTMTGVEDGKPHPVKDAASKLEATLLAGAWVPSWKEVVLNERVDDTEFDRLIAAVAAEAGIDTGKPFVFTAQGVFAELDLHVINGACPMRARMKKIELPAEQQPFETRLTGKQATLVGVFAVDAVGNLTHPDTSTHVHVLFEDETTKEMLTGHVESLRLEPGTVLRLPG